MVAGFIAHISSQQYIKQMKLKPRTGQVSWQLCGQERDVILVTLLYEPKP